MGGLAYCSVINMHWENLGKSVYIYIEVVFSCMLSPPDEGCGNVWRGAVLLGKVYMLGPTSCYAFGMNLYNLDLYAFYTGEMEYLLKKILVLLKRSLGHRGSAPTKSPPPTCFASQRCRIVPPPYPPVQGCSDTPAA